MSQERLADLAHVSSGYLSKLERGQYKSPSKEVLDRLAGALESDPVPLYKAAGHEDLLAERDPGAEAAIAALAVRLEGFPKRDQNIILVEMRRIFQEEAET